MIVSISQPTLFPWLGYFDMIKKSDTFVFLDNVKFQKRSWHMRNQLKVTSKDHEQPTWIRIPTKNKTSNELIMNVALDNDHNWKKTHLKTFEFNYGINIEQIPFLQKLYKKEWTCLSDFNIEFITECCKYLGINTKLKKASELSVDGKKSNLILNICKKVGATKYLANHGSKQYLEKDREIFQNAKIDLEYHDYQHPHYKQRGINFIEKLSILDLLFNKFDKSKEFI
jgi:hypothetical protein